MTTFTRFDKFKLPTEFLDGIYKHIYTGNPSVVETWERLNQLGGGTFGTVYKEKCRETGALRAVKEVRKGIAKSNEIDVLMQLRSYPQHFVQFSAWFEDNLNIYLVMEFLECGDLDALMKDEDLSENDTKTITAQVLEGLEIMHKNNLCHRDLKPENVLIAKWMPLTVKIADFGVSKQFDGTEGRTFAGSQHYMAPEIWGMLPESDTSSYTTAVDIWSLGCMVYTMLTNAPPFPQTRNLIDYVAGRTKFPPDIIPNVTPLAIEFIAGLLMPLPHHRATAERARQHLWVSIQKGDETVWSLSPRPEGSEEMKESLGSLLSELQPLSRPPSQAGIASDMEKAVVRYKAVTETVKPVQGRLEEGAMIAGAASGNIALVQDMVLQGVDIDAGDEGGFTALMGATKGNYKTVIDFLLGKGASLSKVDGQGRAPLHYAAECGNASLVQYFLEIGADTGADVLGGGESGGYTTLFCAAWSGNLDCMKLLLLNGADIKGRHKEGFSPLTAAAEGGHLEVVKYLIELGEDVNEACLDGKRPLHFAAFSRNPDVIKCLISHGAKLTHRCRSSSSEENAIETAALNGDLPSVRLLLELGADMYDVGPKDGHTLLEYAASSRNTELVQFLLDKGFHVNQRSRRGNTALHNAARNGDIPMISLLLHHGADMAARVWTGAREGVLHKAAYSENLDAFQFLIEKGADPNARTVHEWTVLHVAARAGHVQIVDYCLLRLGLRIDQTTEAGYTALHLAVMSGKIELIQLLLARGSNVVARTSKGDTAHSIAKERGHGHIVTFISEVLETNTVTLTYTSPHVNPTMLESMQPTTNPGPGGIPITTIAPVGSTYNLGSLPLFLHPEPRGSPMESQVVVSSGDGAPPSEYINRSPTVQPAPEISSMPGSTQLNAYPPHDDGSPSPAMLPTGSTPGSSEYLSSLPISPPPANAPMGPRVVQYDTPHGYRAGALNFELPSKSPWTFPTVSHPSQLSSLTPGLPMQKTRSRSRTGLSERFKNFFTRS